ncbi:LysR substrate-binding domain-containing protein [Rathayibacter sp. VKM Ac-2857]|uniref:LysR substrate-binding domain-containing protein n=1 Tax=Rathayibacter sp. VKM Ac-2857 TaxID=2739020 RepID=UPI0015661BB8|nr:LysR substrate-binding domain-containing protein [Rathayibacter sp. VKM Ac-2857]NQX16232.1 LysR family transcriptional regulator [Rathayibacter sp. VKM Ac-2857]
MSDEPDPREQPADREDAVGLDDGADAAETDLETPEPGDAEPEGPALLVALVPGVTPTKWTRVWSERRPDLRLRVLLIAESEQEEVLRDGRAQLVFVRGDVRSDSVSSILLYEEQPVAILARDHAFADAEEMDVADLADEHLLQEPEAVPEWAALAAEIVDGTRRALPRMAGLDDAVEQVAAGVGVLIVPQSVARVHSRKDVRVVPVTGVAPTSIRLAWATEDKTDDLEDFIGVVRGRSANTTRGTAATPRVESRAKVAKAKAREAREKAEKAGGGKKKPARPGGTARPAVRRTRKPRGR